MVLIFLAAIVFQRVQCLNHLHEMLCHAMVSDKVLRWPERVQPHLTQEKSPFTAQLKTLFGDSWSFIEIL